MTEALSQTSVENAGNPASEAVAFLPPRREYPHIYESDYQAITGIPPFSRETLIEAASFRLSPEQIENRRLVEGITVDGATTKDRDDGFSVERIGKDFRVEVSIADPTSVIPIDSLTDQTAIQRAFTRYRGRIRKDPMIPRVLSEGLLSLDEGDPRPAITFSYTLDDRLRLGDIDISSTLFKNRQVLSYPQVDELLQTHQGQEEGMLRDAHELGRRLAANRGAIYDFEMGVGTSESGELREMDPEEAYEADMIIRELMILTNQTIPYFLREKGIPLSEIPLIYRNHTGRTNRARYGVTPLGHKGLGLTAKRPYMHVTSPLRRLPDYIVHRQMHGLIDTFRIPYEAHELEEIARHVNESADQERLDEARAKVVYFSGLEEWKARNAIESGQNLNEISTKRLIRTAVKDKTVEGIKDYLLGVLAKCELRPSELVSLIFTYDLSAVEEILEAIYTQNPGLARQTLDLYTSRIKKVDQPTYEVQNSGEGESTYKSRGKFRVGKSIFITPDFPAATRQEASDKAAVHLLKTLRSRRMFNNKRTTRRRT